MLIDTHCHILPGLDDGARTWDEAIEMAQYASSQGIHTIVATPHHGDGRHDNQAEKVDLAVQELSDELEKRHIFVRILSGQEVRVSKGLLLDLDAKRIRTLNHSQYILLELPPTGIPNYFDEVLYELRVLGLTVILAHPERQLDFIANPRLLHSYVEQGCLCQITSQSLMGQFGRKIQKFAMYICQSHLAHLIASDAHNLASRRSNLAEAFSYIEKVQGRKALEQYSLNAACVVRNERIVTETYPYKRRLWCLPLH
ncbi:tyrosine-protein phosphatase [Paenibacillus qinlingensis]|uniref:tyrosine-protein phosphatase n=1 Tax=Paenibacillus qinlingensis TaxID=1837343 RepID=UPI0015675F71|nr:CpsB/CapC family capsule biosynthesis tyrosine phosphatase [Paenibacillus qinlingensis]NQX60412.1 tyrosine protein phosphatase [Paenibacillus qinlingensis]